MALCVCHEGYGRAEVLAHNYCFPLKGKQVGHVFFSCSFKRTTIPLEVGQPLHREIVAALRGRASSSSSRIGGIHGGIFLAGAFVVLGADGWLD